MGEGKVISGVLQGGQRLDKALADASSLSRAQIKLLIEQGKVRVDGAPVVQASGKAPEGAHFTIEVPPTSAETAPEAIPLTVVYEDEHVIVVDKPAGMVVHPAAGNPAGTLVNALLHHCDGKLSGLGGAGRPGIVHRIDKDTSGLLVAAKTDLAHEGLARQFADHSIERVYLAVVNGHPNPPQGTVSGRIGRSEANRKKMAVLPNNSSRGKHAVTHYVIVEDMGHCALVECRLETGRTHQVRVHLASIGHALLGDPRYGRTSAQLRPILQRLGFHRQALHAAVLGFVHPVTSDTLRFTSELPPDIRELIDEVGHSNR
jgi:23S rRNA pseudouridine1911/1915/1917 synthase